MSKHMKSLCLITTFLYTASIPPSLSYEAQGVKSRGNFERTEILLSSVQQPTKQQLEQLAREGVQVCYKSMAPYFEQHLESERNKLAGYGGLSSSAYDQITSQIAIHLGVAIVNQISDLANNLPKDVGVLFLDFCSVEIKKAVGTFCQTNNIKHSSYIDDRIMDQLKFRKLRFIMA
jgi:hypothetical protein